jgi:hypothetical protein
MAVEKMMEAWCWLARMLPRSCVSSIDTDSPRPSAKCNAPRRAGGVKGGGAAERASGPLTPPSTVGSSVRRWPVAEAGGAQLVAVEMGTRVRIPRGSDQGGRRAIHPTSGLASPRILMPINCLGGQLKTGNLWTGQNRQFPARPRPVSSTSFPRPCANRSALWCASSEARI